MTVIALFFAVGPASAQEYPSNSTGGDFFALTVDTIQGEGRLVEVPAVPRAYGGYLLSNATAGATKSFGAVDVVAGTEVPDTVVDIVGTAAQRWADEFDLNGTRIEVKLNWYNIGFGVLGSAGPLMTYQNGVLIPVHMLDAQRGADSDVTDILVNINSAMDWDYSMELDPSIDDSELKYSLFSVALHEIGHGMGITSGWTETGDGNTAPRSWDSHIHDGEGNQVFNDPNQATGNDLWFHQDGGARYRVYAPSVWSSGSSLSHLDEQAYPAGDDAALMTPRIGRTERYFNLSGITLGLAETIGWTALAPAPEPEPQLNPVPATPTISSLTVNNGVISANLAEGNTTGRERAGEISVTISRDGTTLRRIGLAGTGGTVNLDVDNTPGTYRVDAQAKVLSTGTVSPTASKTITIDPPAPTCRVSGPSTTFRSQTGTHKGASTWRLYQAFFLRQPDSGGFKYWLEIRTKVNSLEAIAGWFEISEEFRSTYGSLNNAGFVDLVYQNVLCRTPDSGGRSYWIDLLNKRRLTRGGMMIQFSESAEYLKKTGTKYAYWS